MYYKQAKLFIFSINALEKTKPQRQQNKKFPQVYKLIIFRILIYVFYYYNMYIHNTFFKIFLKNNNYVYITPRAGSKEYYSGDMSKLI